MTPVISVVVPTFNRRDLIERTVRALGVQDYPSDRYEVIVAVDGSGDGSAEHLRRLSLPCAFRVLEQPNRGQAAAKNLGLRESRGRLVLFLDDDFICPPRLVREHVVAHGDEPDLVVFGPIFTAPDSVTALSTAWTAAIWEEHFGRLASGACPEWPTDAYVRPNSSAPRGPLLETRGFDERLSGREDFELGLRLWKAGLRFRFAPRALVHETFVKGTTPLVRRDARKHGRTEALVCAAHPDWRRYSILGRCRATPGWKAPLLWAAACAPVSPEPLLAAPCHVAEAFHTVPVMRRLGLELVRARWAMVKLRAAIETAGGRRAVGLEYGTRLPVLAWDAGVAASAGGLDRLARHLRALAGAGYRGIRPSDWLRWTDAGEPLPRRPVLLTFDGESRALGDRVLPLVREHGFEAAVFVATACLGRAGSLSPGQVEQWARAGIEFGARGRRGRGAARSLDSAALVDEVEGSAADLAALLGRRPTGFAYPPGGPAEPLRQRVSLSFPLAFTREPGFNRLAGDPHRLRRIPMDRESTFGLRWALRCGRRVPRPRHAGFPAPVQEAEVTA